MDLRITEQDYEVLRSRGILPEDIRQQLNFFKEGLTPANLQKPCTVGDGILQLADSDHKGLLVEHKQAAEAGRITKFVPASGAATRMFKSLMAGLELLQASPSSDPVVSEDIIRFIDRQSEFAFGSQLKRACVNDTSPVNILRTLLSREGLGYADLPKGLIPFHKYPNGSRTAFEEHLVEALAYAQDGKGVARLHFTVAANFRERITAFIEDVTPRFSTTGGRFDIQYSVQHLSTDTIAVTLDDQPLRDRDDNMVFRPGGHGALLKNLDALNGDIVFIKNIDNVVPDRHKEMTILYKKLLGGLLIKLQTRLFHFLRLIKEGKADQASLDEAVAFLHNNFRINIPEADKLDDQNLADVLFRQLNRPLRICGMVKNEGEPGGGPFWVKGENETLSSQIVESAQVNLDDPGQRGIWESSTHFNPVDLVCGLRDYRGKPFKLADFLDPRSGFISHKSFEGGNIKALELPGLWNGAMAYWNTLFVEVPIITFNPVKTVFDLLRPEHR